MNSLPNSTHEHIYHKLKGAGLLAEVTTSLFISFLRKVDTHSQVQYLVGVLLLTEQRTRIKRMTTYVVENVLEASGQQK